MKKILKVSMIILLALSLGANGFLASLWFFNRSEIADLQESHEELIEWIEENEESKKGSVEEEIIKTENETEIETENVTEEVEIEEASDQKTEEILALFETYDLSRVDFNDNYFFWESLMPLDSENYDYSMWMEMEKESLRRNEERSKELGIYNDLVDYGLGLLMDAIIPYSSILLLFQEEEEAVEKSADELVMEVNFNIAYGKSAGLKQEAFMYEIQSFYKKKEEESLTADEIERFAEEFIRYYEEDLSTLATIYTYREKVELMNTLFYIKTETIYEWDEAEQIAIFDEEMEKINTSLEQLEKLYEELLDVKGV